MDIYKEPALKPAGSVTVHMIIIWRYYKMLIAVFLFGLIIGSFLNVCVYRVPRGQSIISPRSACPSCETQLIAIDLVPVLSWLFLRGKCRHCRAAISVQYPIVELLTGVIFAFTWLRADSPILFLAYAFMEAVMLTVMFTDLEKMIIPDVFVVAGLSGGVVFQIWKVASGYGVWWDGLTGATAGAGTFLLVALISEAVLKKEGMGGGDIKFMLVVGMFLGLKLTVLCLFLSVVLGGIAGAALLIKGRKAGDTVMPFGPFIVAAALICVFFGNGMIVWYLNNFML